MAMKRLQQRLRDESGMSYVFIGLGMMALLSASMLAIDVGMLMTARNQAQNSADAGALGGATALIFDDWDDRTDTGPAKTTAIATAKENTVMAGEVSVEPADVEFLPNPVTGEQSRVRVTVYRTPSRGNPLSTLIASYFGMPTAGVGAVATAEAAPADAMTCVLPFTIPDRWREIQTPPHDLSDSFDMFEQPQNTPLSDPDIYINANDKVNYTGYTYADVGTRLRLKASNGSKIESSFYYAWAMGEYEGAEDYSSAICGCTDILVGFEQILTAEPGNMVGPTAEGVNCLIARDPTARWDEATNKVVDSAFPNSPRIRPLPLFNPEYYEVGKHEGRNASLMSANFLGFFIEEMQGSEVVGVITPIAGRRTGGQYGTTPAAAFPRTVRLVK